MIPVYLRTRPTTSTAAPWLELIDSRTARKGNDEHSFAQIFDNASQQDVYSECVDPLVQNVLAGESASFFTLGATGSGKTYTVQGTESCPGMVHLALDRLLAKCPQVTIAMVEIYNDKLYDLLDGTRRPVTLRSTGEVDAMRLPALNAGAALEVLNRGYAARAVQSTNMNSRSSRSHCFTLIQVGSATLTIADLAGSERLNDAGSVGAQRIEAGEINKSLMMLGQALQSLQQGASPQRGSKLSQMLLAGVKKGAKTVMLVTIDRYGNMKSGVQILRYATQARHVPAVSPCKLAAISSAPADNISMQVYSRLDGALARAIEGVFK